MRILIDVLHPAHVHFFRPFLVEMERRSHVVAVTAREKEMTVDLLERYDVDHTVLSRQATGKLGLGVELLTRTARLLRVARRFRPDVLLGIMGPSIAPVGRILGVPSIVFYDTEHAEWTNRVVYALADEVCTPDCYLGGVPGRHVTYPGYHEMAYLHPSRFTPDPLVLGEFGLSEEEPYFLARFVAWKAIHDVGARRLTPHARRRIVDTLARKGRVVVSAEDSLPESVPGELLDGPVEKIHHVIAHAGGVVGESATMCSEAAVLGVPAVYVNPLRLGYLEEQEAEYGLVRNRDPADLASILEAVEALPWPGVEAAHRRLLEEKVDVTRWMVDFVEGAHDRGAPVGGNRTASDT